jgi:DNA-binding winged helix-turn-helix (wHTH) protein
MSMTFVTEAENDWGSGEWTFGAAGSSDARVVFEFDSFELDEALFELRRHGQRVHLQPKVFALLAYAVRHHDRVVTKSELLSALWPRQAVGEGSVTRAVRAARAALGDRGDCQDVLRTVRGFGFRFVRPVRVRSSRYSAVFETREAPRLVRLHDDVAHWSSNGHETINMHAIGRE